MNDVRLVIVDPGHFHSALIQKDTYPQVAPQVSVYSPLGPELADYLSRVHLFNTRKDNPTRWELNIHTGEGFFERMLAERAGNVAVFAGRNREKIARIVRSLEAGYHVLADKPWIIASADLPRLATALDLAGKKGLVGYDIMTERYEITSILQKELVNEPAVFGRLVQGSEEEPAVSAMSIHHLMKQVSGVPLRRPSWFFNIDENGEGIADVGTHVIDLIQWTAFPGVQMDYRADVRMLDARRWPTRISKTQFSHVTGEADFPAYLAPWVRDGQLDYFCNNSARYAVRGAHVAVEVLWNWEAPAGFGDIYQATFRGTKADIEIRQGREENYLPELYVRPHGDEVLGALRGKIDAMQKDWPGVEMRVESSRAHILIPAKYRVGHEAHFAQVMRAFLGYLKDPNSLPAWERSNMLLKYYICTTAVDLSRGGGRN
ncbi:MAG: putative oxidoreductase C-terminal domain-containing protein [Bryobacteraceae bacterium]